MRSPVKVLYIAGMPHSGSTILSQVLGEVPGVTALGELYYLWDAHEKGLPCGCGEPLADCPWWSEVLGAAFRDRGAVADLRPSSYYMALQQLPTVMLARSGAPSREYRDGLQQVIRAAAEREEARVIVDASKSPTVGRILDGLPGVDLHLLHLVRAPQAVANSWSRFAGEAGRPARHASVWSAWNTSIELLWGRRRGRYLRLRYEDFANRPREATAAIARFVGEAGAGLPFVSERTARLGVTHTVAGNDVRFRGGDVEIRLDEAWRDHYPERERRVLEPLTWPLRKRYGYA